MSWSVCSGRSALESRYAVASGTHLSCRQEGKALKPDMTTLHRIELTCPICGNHFGSQAVASTNSFGGKRTNFHERAAGMQPLAFLIHMCACCGYAGSEHDFDEGADVSLDVKERVRDELAPRLVAGRGGSGGDLPGSEKYEAAARIAEWQGAEPRHVGDLFLRAAWCCVDEGDGGGAVFQKACGVDA